jgi:putative heme degradation protein
MAYVKCNTLFHSTKTKLNLLIGWLLVDATYALHLQSNTVARSLNVYTSSAVVTAWYHFTE